MEERLGGGELLAAVRGTVATLTLNRPAAHNALSMEMLQGIGERLDAWEADDRVRTIVLRGAGDKAFCAGGDIRALRDSIESGTPMHREFMRAEYALDHRIHNYPKTIVAVMDGIVMGGGMGIGQGARLRIVGDRTRMAMPETMIGLFPDVGASWFLSRVPGEVGAYLGLLGPTITAADALYCGLADLHIGTNAPSELERLRPAIDRHFAHRTIEAIALSLATEEESAYRPWAEATRAGLAQRSPTLLKVTLEQLRRGRDMTLADCLRMELGLVNACFDQGDVREGIRARIVDKDNAPRWNPPRLEDVDRAAVDAFFAPRWSPAQHPLASLS
jgi:enoyl-CoA hydratase/carnithine racemase